MPMKNKSLEIRERKYKSFSSSQMISRVRMEIIKLLKDKGKGYKNQRD